MGYSIATPIKNKQLKQRAFSFLKEHYTDIGPKLGISELSEPAQDGDLSYDHSKCCIGFDYCGSLAHFYLYPICKFIALKVGKTVKQVKTEDFTFKSTTPFPYIVYDGGERWPVLLEGVHDVPSDMEWCLVDEYGLKTRKTEFDDAQSDFFKKFYEFDIEEITRKELERLSLLWSQSS